MEAFEGVGVVETLTECASGCVFSSARFAGWDAGALLMRAPVIVGAAMDPAARGIPPRLADASEDTLVLSAFSRLVSPQKERITKRTAGILNRKDWALLMRVSPFLSVSQTCGLFRFDQLHESQITRSCVSLQKFDATAKPRKGPDRNSVRQMSRGNYGKGLNRRHPTRNLDTCQLISRPSLVNFGWIKHIRVLRHA